MPPPVQQGHKDSVEALVVDGLYLFSGGCDGTVRVWNVSSLALEGEVARRKTADVALALPK